MRILFIIGTAILLFNVRTRAQKPADVTNKTEVTRLEQALSSDRMEGRKIFTKGIDQAARFITNCFQEAGLKKWPGADGYEQPFEMVAAEPETLSIKWGRQSLPKENLLEITTEKEINWDNQSTIKIDSITSRAGFGKKIRGYLHPEQNTLVWIDSSLKTVFISLKKYLAGQRNSKGSPTLLFILAGHPAKDFHIQITNKLTAGKAANIIGFLPGKGKRNEYVIFSAHYDHLGTDASLQGDTIYNGANDDASGTTAVIELARYFSQKNDNERSLIFVTFTGEEEGGYGSHYFSRQLDPDKIAAMFNIEMIGTPSKWGKNSAYITGFEKSSLGPILQQNLKGTGFQFHPDPYPNQHLFYRSDNATLARLGVPAHTISTSKMDSEPNYHKVSDEISTLDMDNMTKIIRSIALSAESIINGTDTPTRVRPEKLQ